MITPYKTSNENITSNINDSKHVFPFLEKPKTRNLMPCLFPGIHFPGNHFPHFPMFGKHKENQSKETQFQSTKK
jgi:hypothetical protein